jgi:replicative DNA helicase
MQLARAKAENRTQEVTLISQELKTAGLEMGRISGGTLIAIAQLNRAVEYRADRRPQLSDLRESGQIEQDADVVMFISTDLSTVKGPSDPHVKNIDIAKQKNGPLDTVRLVFLPQITGFEEATGG